MPAGLTAFEALNSSLPKGTMDSLKSSSSSRPRHMYSPGAVHTWEEAEPGKGTNSLNEAILAYQEAADKQNRW